MKKQNVLNLIRYHGEQNDIAFRNEAYAIAQDFAKNNDEELAEYIIAQLSSVSSFTPQINENDLSFFKKVSTDSSPLPLPDIIKDDVFGIVNAIKHNVGVNKFLFEGAPGTGKTETAKYLSEILHRELFSVSFTDIIDSKLGETSKNISKLFSQMNSFDHPDKVVFLFDEFDSIAMDRINSNDLREMGRATSQILKEFDNLSSQVLLIATTNLFSNFEKALTRRFDFIIDFNRYTKEDLLDVADIILDYYLDKFPQAGRNMRLFRKILSLLEIVPYPGELKNLIKVSLAFSKNNEPFDYLKRLYKTVTNTTSIDLKLLKIQNFTLREIEILTGISKSQAARELK